MPPPTRSTRQSSRTSSPFAAARNSPAPVVANSKTEQTRPPTQEWVEPPLAPRQPSFMDHRFDRTSIFQAMQPLGNMPSAKLRQKMRENHTRRFMAGEPADLISVDEEQASTETTPAVERPRSESRIPEPTPAEPAPTPKVQEQEQVQEQQEEYKPQGEVLHNVTKPPERVQRLKITNINGATPTTSPSKTPPPTLSTPPQAQQLASPSIQIPLPSQPATPSPLKSPIKMSNNTHLWNKEASAATLQSASARADDIGGRKAMISKLALMEAFRLAENDEKLYAALAAIGAGTATTEQVRRFNNYIKRSKIRLRKALADGAQQYDSIVQSIQQPTDNISLSAYSLNNTVSSTPVSGHPATNISAPAEGDQQPPQTFTPPGNPPASLFHFSEQPALPGSVLQQQHAQVAEVPRPNTPKAVAAPAAVQTPDAKAEQLPSTDSTPIVRTVQRRASPKPAGETPAVRTTKATETPKPTDTTSARRTPQESSLKLIDAISSVQTPQAQTSPKPVETVSAVQTPQATDTPNGELLQPDAMETPVKQGSEQDSDGELSDVNETLIRRVENENYMQAQAGADSGDEQGKRRGVKDKRVTKGQPNSRRAREAAREKAQQKALEEEQRLDVEREQYREHYLKERVPVFPKKEDYVESHERTLPTPPVQSPPQANGHPPAASTRSHYQADPPIKTEQLSLGELQLNGARKRSAEELDDSASSLTEDLGSTPFNSAPGTPVLPPPSKKQKTAAKTKISPMKPRNGVVTSLSRPGGGRGTPFANDDNDKTSEDEHSDFCVACGGEGELLCCDGCDAAYHFQCCDPPLSKDSPELEEAWFCPKCRPLPRRSREASPDARDSIWGDMSNVKPVERHFHLPKYLQTYFEDNSVGLDGEYVTGSVAYSRASHAKDGTEEHPDYYRLIDKKEKAILCCQCLQGVGFENSRRPIIQCDKTNCYAYWHLDCLDPPLANPPTRGWQKGYQKTRMQWICPRHAEHDYRNIQSPAFSSLSDQVMPTSVSGITRHRMRIPRKPEYIDYRRGMDTDGRIDIVNRDEDDDSALRFVEEEDNEGKVVRVPEDDVKLNFIAKVKADRMMAEHQGLLRRSKSSHVDPAFQRRSFNDQRAALSLAQFAQRQDEIDLNADGVAQLVYAVIAQADGEVDGGDVAPNFGLDVNDSKQRAQLIKISRLIDMALASGDDPVRIVRKAVNSHTPSIAPAVQAPEGPVRLSPAPFPRASSMQPTSTRPSKRQRLEDIADSDALEVRSDGGFGPNLPGSLDDRAALSAPGSRPSSRRESRRTSNRKSGFGSK